jgi:hypothetical protein
MAESPMDNLVDQIIANRLRLVAMGMVFLVEPEVIGIFREWCEKEHGECKNPDDCVFKSSPEVFKKDMEQAVLILANMAEVMDVD